MKAVAVAFQVGNKLDKCIIAFWAPGPPNAIKHIAGINIGLLSMSEYPNKMHPTAINAIDIIEHTRGPYKSNTIPSNNGPKKLKKDANVNII